MMKYALAFILGFLLGWAFLPGRQAWPMDRGQWENSDPEVRRWYQSLMQPDTLGTMNPVSCCGSGDAYWADEVHVEGDKVIATVTDDRSDAPLGRQHVPPGTRYVIPSKKVVDVTKQNGNPTNHAVLFLGTVSWVNGNANPSSRAVLCYVQGAGI